MTERHQHTNPWADKLSQVTIPDREESWKALEALLDRRMPTGGRKGRRRWLLLILLLLLLVGVCNCPGKRWFAGISTRETGRFEEVPGVGKAARGPSAGSTKPTGAQKTNPPDSITTAATPSVPPTGGTTVAPFSPSPASNHKSVNHHRYISAPGSPSGGSFRLRNPGYNPSQSRSPSPASPSSGLPSSGSPASGSPPTGSSRLTTPVAGSPGPPASVSARKDSVHTSVPPVKDSLHTSSPANRPARKDSARKKPPPTTEDQQKNKDGGIMVGIGLNQFFRIGGQQASSFNSDGITGTLSDYIPVPMIRYYYNNRLYVQLEAQINTPQYTKKDVVITAVVNDTTTNPTQSINSSVSVNKLFYFNVPLSIHYNLFDHFDLGAGLQFSRLTNGVGNFNQQIYSRGTGTLESASAGVKSFKGDSLFNEIRTDEFRFLIDANYTWKHFIGGIRYNRALTDYINIKISATQQVTQARNTSLQLYLRYILWDGRKKKPLP
ncbi:MAG TPA: hypothetical protein VL978_10600 [Puia sp.]|nr:hypothetical protein [Puia sp.]